MYFIKIASNFLCRIDFRYAVFKFINTFNEPTTLVSYFKVGSNCVKRYQMVSIECKRITCSVTGLDSLARTRYCSLTSRSKKVISLEIKR